MPQATFLLVHREETYDLKATTAKRAQEEVVQMLFPSFIDLSDSYVQSLIPPVFEDIEGTGNLGPYGFQEVRKRDYVNGDGVYILRI